MTSTLPEGQVSVDVDKVVRHVGALESEVVRMRTALKALVAPAPDCERGRDGICHHCFGMPLFDKEAKRWGLDHEDDCPWVAAKKLVEEA